MRSARPATVQFRLSKDNVVYARVYKNGIRSKDFSTGIVTNREEYDARNLSGGLKEALDSIRKKLTEADSKYEDADAETLKEVILRQGRITFVDLLKEFVDKKKSEKYLSYRTKQTYESQARCLIARIGEKNVEIDKVDEGYAQKLLDKCAGKDSKNYILKLIQLMKQVTGYAHQKGYTKRNMLQYFRFNFDRPEIVFLTESQVEALELHSFASKNLTVARDLFLFQCWTGLAYSDLKTVHPDMITVIRNKAYIFGRRNKTGVSFTAPVPKKAMALLQKWEGRPQTLSNQYYNRMLKEIALILGIEQKLTTHMARKTAGMRWLNMGYSIEAVSRMLGHSKVDTTQRWYARVLPDRVIRETEEIESR